MAYEKYITKMQLVKTGLLRVNRNAEEWYDDGCAKFFIGPRRCLGKR